MNVLEEALAAVSGPRAATYGDPVVNFANIAQIATALTGRAISPEECVLVLLAVKLGRLRQSPDHRDSIVDVAGYAAVLARVSGVDQSEGINLSPGAVTPCDRKGVPICPKCGERMMKNLRHQFVCLNDNHQ